MLLDLFLAIVVPAILGQSFFRSIFCFFLTHHIFTYFNDFSVIFFDTFGDILAIHDLIFNFRDILAIHV